MGQLASAPITVIIVGICVMISVLMHFHVVDRYILYFNKDRICGPDLELWRLFTSLFSFGDLNVMSVVHIYIFAERCMDLENSFFNTRPADFLLCCLIAWCVAWGWAWVMPAQFLGEMFSAFILYYSSKRAPDAHLWFFGFPVPGGWVPWVMLGVYRWWGMHNRFLLQQAVSYMAAHVYFFVADILGLRYGVNVFHLPNVVNRGLRKLLAI